MSKNFHRKRVLIRPRLQWRLVGAFLGAACISTIVQVLLLNVSLGRIAADLPVDGNVLLDAMPGIIGTQVLLTFGLMAPLVVAVGILETFRIFGPLYRFEMYLKEIIAGLRPEPCRIRKEDELQDFCKLLNEATQPHLEKKREARRANQAAQETAPPLLPKRESQTMVVLD